MRREESTTYAVADLDKLLVKRLETGAHGVLDGSGDGSLDDARSDALDKLDRISQLPNTHTQTRR
jgi:hypothetical protein